MEKDQKVDADLVLRGGVVLVLDESGGRAEAIAVSGGRIIAVGRDGEIARCVGQHTQVIELDGRAVIPGINDAHLHGTHFGAVWPDTLFGGGAERVESHRVESREELRSAALRAGQKLSALGVTSYTEPGLGPGEDDGDSGCCGSAAVEVYEELAARGELLQRITVLGLYGLMDGPSSLEVVCAGIGELASRHASLNPRWFRVAGVKIFGDLIPMAESAWTRHSYSDGSHGGLLVEGDSSEGRAAALAEMVRAAHVAGLQVGVHATGDRTIQVVIDAVREAAELPGALPSRDLAHYIIHGDLIEESQVEQLAELGMLWNTQPGIMTAVEPAIAKVLGVDVARDAWPVQAGLARQIVTLSSDAPVVDPDWRRGIAAAEARSIRQGAGEGHGEANMRLLRLLRAYTAVSAEQDRAGAWKGTLEVGKVADLVVLAQDPFQVGAAGLPDVDVDYTVLDGRVVFAREDGSMAQV